MVRATNSVTATEDELADLQRRFHLLEGDRKAFYEASQWTIKQNKETLELVKEVSQPGDSARVWNIFCSEHSSVVCSSWNLP